MSDMASGSSIISLAGATRAGAAATAEEEDENADEEPIINEGRSASRGGGIYQTKESI